MTTLLAIDPGLRGCGCALFDNERLYWCAYVRSGSTAPDLQGALYMAAAVERELVLSAKCLIRDLVVEWPQVYVGGKQKGDANDLLCLAAVDAALAGRASGIVTRYRPCDWKKQVPKDIMGARILAKLGAHERAIFDACGVPKSLAHNVADGIGLALHHLGRLR